MIEQLQTNHAKILAYTIRGKLQHADYEAFVPLLDTAIATAGGKVRLFIQFEDFQGWELHAAWDDLKIGLKHYAAFERVALVGTKQWEEWMSRFWGALTPATVKYFDVTAADTAWAWLREGA